MADIKMPAKVIFLNAKSTSLVKLSIFSCNFRADDFEFGSFNSAYSSMM